MTLIIFLMFLVPFVAMETNPDISLNNVITLVGQKFEYLVGDEKFLEKYEIYKERGSIAALKEWQPCLHRLVQYYKSMLKLKETRDGDKVVERGSKKLPDWLSFDRNTSLLVGVPLQKDVGIFNIRMRACMIEKTNTDCQNKISRSFQIDVIEPLRSEAERGSPYVPVHAGNGNRLWHHGIFGIYSKTMHEPASTKISSSAVHEINYIKENVYFRYCEYGEITFYASLVLHVGATLSGMELVFLIDSMSKFLSKDVSFIRLSLYDSNIFSMTNRHMITAGPGNIVASLNNSIELIWHVACASFEHVSDFSKVLHHNIDSGRLTAELGCGIIAWYVFADRRINNRVKRNAVDGARKTATPSMTPPLPSKMSVFDVTDSTLVMSATVFKLSSSYSSTSLDTLLSTISMTSDISSSIFSDFTESESLRLSSITSSVGSTVHSVDIEPSFTVARTTTGLRSTSSMSLISSVKIEEGISFSHSYMSSSVLYSSFSLIKSSSIRFHSDMLVTETGTNIPKLAITSTHSFFPSLYSSSVVYYSFSEPRTFFNSKIITVISENESSVVYTTSMTLTSVPFISSELDASLFSSSVLFRSFSTVVKSSLLSVGTVFTSELSSSHFSLLVSSDDATINIGISSVTPSSIISYADISTIDNSVSLTSHDSYSIVSSSELSNNLVTILHSTYLMPSERMPSADSLVTYIDTMLTKEATIKSSYSYDDLFTSVTSPFRMSYFSQFQETSVKSLKDSNVTSLPFYTYLSFSHSSPVSMLTPELMDTTVSVLDSTFSSMYLVPVFSSVHRMITSSNFSSSFSETQSFLIITDKVPSGFVKSTFVDSSSVMTFLVSLDMTRSSSISSESAIVFADSTMARKSSHSSVMQSLSPAITSISKNLSIYPSFSTTTKFSLLLLETGSDSASRANFGNTSIIPSFPSSSFLEFVKTSYLNVSAVFISTEFSSITSVRTIFFMSLLASHSSVASDESYPIIFETTSMYLSMSHPQNFTGTLLETALPVFSETLTTSWSYSSIPKYSAVSTMQITVSSKLSDQMFTLSKITSSFLLESLDSVTFISEASPLPTVRTDIFLSKEITRSKRFTILSVDTLISSVTSSKALYENLSVTEIYSSVNSTLGLSSIPWHSTYNMSVSKTSVESFVQASSIEVPVSTLGAEKSSVKLIGTAVLQTSQYSSSTMIATTAVPDGAPKLQSPINQLEVHVGKYYQYRVPHDTFNDTEDGDTRNLSLSVTLVYGKPLPQGSWLMFNEETQTIYGIPLWQDIMEDTKNRIMTIILSARDSAGQIEKDAIQLVYNKSHVMGHSHKINLKFSGSYKDFMKSRNNLISVAKDIAGFYRDSSLDFLTFLEISSGSLNVVWSNSSLAGEQCDKRKIQDLFNQLIYPNGSVKEELVDLFSNSSLNITSATLEFVGDCLLPLTTTTALPVVTDSPASSTDDDKIWIEVVIPALVAILLLVIVALILLICCRHRRSRKKLSKSEKPMFLEDRRPIIFPEELEMTDPNLKPKTPLVLPSDLVTDHPPPVPPHRSRDLPQYQVPPMDDDVFLSDNRSPPPPQFDQSQGSDPPPYRLPPPYFNPHRSNR